MDSRTSPEGDDSRYLCVLQIAVSIASHLQELRDLTHAARYEVVENPSREDLTAKWQEWVQAAGPHLRPLATVQCCSCIARQGLHIALHVTAHATCAC